MNKRLTGRNLGCLVRAVWAGLAPGRRRAGRKGAQGSAECAFPDKAAQDVCTIYDFHATVLHLLGLDHEKLTFYHNGSQRRLTDVHGDVIEAVLA